MLQIPADGTRPLDVGTARAHDLSRAARSLLLAGTDATMILFASTIAYLSWAAPVRHQSAETYLDLAPLVLLFIAGYARLGLYPGLGLGPVETLRRLSYVTTFFFLLLAAASFALQVPYFYSRVTYLLAFVLSLVLVPLGRIVLLRIVRRWSWWAEPVVVIGAGRRAAQAIQSIRHARHLGYRVVGVLTADGESGEGDLEGAPIYGGLDQAAAVSASGIRVALVDTELQRTRPAIDRLEQAFRHVIVLQEFGDLPIERLQVRNLGTLVGIEYTNNLLRPGNQTAKRVLDLVVGTIAFVLLLPVIAMAALLVRIVDGGPAFFSQERPGLGGRPIRVPKIRTMRRNADRELEEYFTNDPALRDEWETSYKLRQDPRLIPGIGPLFRRFSIDELPQFWSVIVGDMSLVGPRPFPDYHLAKFRPAFRELRQRVRPGITGLWQITVRNRGGIDAQEAFDTYYIRNWSVWFDIYILYRTVAAVASGRDAF